MNERSRVVIVGGGIVGIACAHYLQKAGLRVTLLDRDRIGGGCSHGNCGYVSPSHVLPLAEPGALKYGIKAMLNRREALRIRPRIDPHLWRWLWRFARRCNRRDMIESASAINPLLKSSASLYRQIIQAENLDCQWTTRGLLFVYKDQRRLDAYEPTNRLLSEHFDEPAQRIDGDELVELEPALNRGLAGGWYFERDAHLRPDRLIASWHENLVQRGVEFLEYADLKQLEATAGRVTAARLSNRLLEADDFVFATGAWTPQLAKLLGYRIPIEPGKGYSITYAAIDGAPRIPMLFPESRVGVTPFADGLRLGSTMEFAGYDSSIRPERLQLLTDAARQFLRTTIPDQIPDPWYGWRPMTYDSTPVIGRCPGFKNVYLATGHNMLGLSMAPATGRLVCEMICNETPHLSTECYAAGRFSV